MDFFHSKIHFAKLSNLMPCINELYLLYHSHITPRTSCDSLPLCQSDENILLYLTHFVVAAANGHHTVYYGRTIHFKVSEIASRKFTVFLRPCEPHNRLLYCLCVIHRENWLVRKSFTYSKLVKSLTSVAFFPGRTLTLPARCLTRGFFTINEAVVAMLTTKLNTLSLGSE